MTFPAKVYESHEGPTLKATKSNADTSEFLMDAVIEACRKAEGCSAHDGDAADHQSSPSSPHPDSSDYPCVDISSWVESPRDPARAADRKGAIAAVLGAATTKGAFHIKGHGVPMGVISTAMKASKEFFSQPLESKVACKTEGQLTGYVPVETESVNALFGRKGGRDQRELYGFVTPSKDPSNKLVDDGVAASASHLPAIKAYAEHMDRLEATIYEVLTEALRVAKGVDLPSDFLLKSKGGSGSLLRVNRYPASASPPADKTGELPGHSDWGAITILYADAPGLEEIHGDGAWVPVKPEPEALHVNLGDNLHIWSNGLFVNNVHRVSTPSGPCGRPARTSLAYFSAQAQNGTENVAIEPVCAAGEVPTFEKVSVRDYVAAGIRRYLLAPAAPEQ